MMLSLSLFAVFALGSTLDAVGQPTAAPPVTQEAPLEDIVVTARRGAPPPLLDAAGYYKRLCFEPARLTRRFSPPDDDSDWQPLTDKVRVQFGIADPEVPAFGLVDGPRAQTLLIKFERFALAGKLTEIRCTLVILGGDHAKLVDQVSKLFGGPGTQRHVGHADGVERIPGWRQWVWTGRPQRRSKNWRVVEAAGAARAGGTWIRVIDPSLFYREMDYILGDLKTKTTPGRPVSVLSFTYTTSNL